MRSSEEIPQMFPVPGRSPEKHMVFIIGGSYGLHPSIKAEANTQLSMSPMTFPHHLARVMPSHNLTHPQKCGMLRLCRGIAQRWRFGPNRKEFLNTRLRNRHRAGWRFHFTLT